MKVTILGSGTVVPNGRRNSAGYFVELPGAGVMLDCGAGTVHALNRYRIDWERMTHLFVSHFHVDHIGELASLFFAFKYGMRRVRSEPLTLLGPQGLERVIAGLKQAFGDNLFEPNFPVEVRLLAPGERLEIGPNSHLSVAKTPHSPESLAVRIEAGGATLCYTGDTDYSEDLARFFEEADLVISECSFTERREGVPHLSIRDAARMAEAARARRLVVTHFYFEVDEEALKNAIEKDYSGDVSIGKDGLALDIQPALC